MKIDTKELQQVAAAEAPRHDLYTGIHKALRALMTDTLLAVGRMDTEDRLEVAQTTQRVLQLMDFCRGHLQHENDFVHAAIEARAPGASAQIAHEHEEHERHISEIAIACSLLLEAPSDLRAMRAQYLYRSLALFIAENFRHMHVEETAHNAVLWARYTDAELEMIHGALVASIPPEEMMAVIRWMVPFMNPVERVAVLSDMRAHAPVPAFAAALQTIRPHLAEHEWTKLVKSLGL